MCVSNNVSLSTYEGKSGKIGLWPHLVQDFGVGWCGSCNWSLTRNLGDGSNFIHLHFMGTPWLASRQAQLWVCRFLLLSPVFTAPLPLILLSSNFLNCKCRGKCNPILKQVPSKLERPSFLSELTCGKYLSIFHIWIYASSLLLRVWFVAQKTFKTCQTLLRQMDDFLHAVDRQLLFLTMISC